MSMLMNGARVFGFTVVAIGLAGVEPMAAQAAVDGP